jgi:transposase-like protein
VNFQEVVHSAQTENADVAKQKRFAEDRMDTHKNARLTPKGREEMVRAVVEGGLSKAAAARRYNTTPKTVAKWADRFRKEGVIVFGERHLCHLLQSYFHCYNEALTHLSLDKDAPISRGIEAVGRIFARPVFGGLHHQYVRIY